MTSNVMEKYVEIKYQTNVELDLFVKILFYIYEV